MSSLVGLSTSFSSAPPNASAETALTVTVWPSALTTESEISASTSFLSTSTFTAAAITVGVEEPEAASVPPRVSR